MKLIKTTQVNIFNPLLLEQDKELVDSVIKYARSRSRGFKLLFDRQAIFEGDCALVYASRGEKYRDEVLDLAQYITPQTIEW